MEFVPFTRPSLIREDLEAVLGTMVNDKLGPGDMGTRYGKELAARYRCYGAIVFRDTHRAISALYAFCASRGKRRILLSPLADDCWLHTTEKSNSDPDIDIIHPPLIARTVIADYGAISPDTYDCVLAESTLGYIPDYRAILKSGKTLIEVIGAGLGGMYDGKDIGTFGDIAIIELEEDNIITCGGGAAVLCRRKEDYSALSTSINLSPGAVLPDINAALGITQLHRLEQFAKKRKSIERAYLQRIPKEEYQYASPFSKKYIPYSFAIKYPRNKIALQKFARAHGIELRRAFEHPAIARSATTRQPESAKESGAQRKAHPPNINAAAAKDKPLPNRNESQAFRNESRAFRDSDKALRDDDRAFRDESQAFRDEGKTFRDESKVLSAFGASERAYIDEVARHTILFPLYPQLSATAIKRVEKIIANMP